MSRVYFTDRDLGKQFPAILRNARLEVERHVDLFAPAGSDEQWLEYCGKMGRVAISHDQRIRHKVNERDAVIRNGVSLLIVVGKAPFALLAHNFVRTLNRIETFLDGHPPPHIAKIYRPGPSETARNANAPGSILMWYSKG